MRCHAAALSPLPRRGPPRLRPLGQPRVPTPGLSPHSGLISFGRLLPGLVTGPGWPRLLFSETAVASLFLPPERGLEKREEAREGQKLKGEECGVSRLET